MWSLGPLVPIVAIWEHDEFHSQSYHCTVSWVTPFYTGVKSEELKGLEMRQNCTHIFIYDLLCYIGICTYYNFYRLEIRSFFQRAITAQ